MAADDGRGSQRDSRSSAKSGQASKSSASNSDGRGSQRDSRASAAAAKSSIGSGNSGSNDGRGSQRDARSSAAASKSGIGSGNSGSQSRNAASISGSDGRGSQRGQVQSARSAGFADSVSKSIGQMAQSVSGALGLGQIADSLRSTAQQGAIDILNGGPAKTKSVNLGGLTGNARTIAERWAAAGWTEAQIRGGLGRISVESDFNPQAIRKNDAGPGKHSKGIAQWNRERLSNLQGYAAAKGADWNDVAVQADFVNHEMFGDKDKRVAGKYGAGVEARAAKAMKAATNETMAAEAMMHYERPYGYKSTNPRAGMHWDKTVSRTNQYAGLMGQSGEATQVASADMGFGDMVASALGGVFGGTQGSSAPTTQTAYVDPYVVTPNSKNKGAAAIEEAAPGSGQVAAVDLKKDPRNRPREGVAKLGQQLEEGNILGAAKMISDPVGLALGTIEDMWNQNGGLEGLKSDLAGIGTGDFKMTAGKSPIGSGNSGSQDRDNDNFLKKKKKAVNETPAPTAVPTPELAVTPVVREPFGWSTLLAGIGPGIKTI